MRVALLGSRSKLSHPAVLSKHFGRPSCSNERLPVQSAKVVAEMSPAKETDSRRYCVLPRQRYPTIRKEQTDCSETRAG
jgi:hypothetical protein